MKKFIFMLLLSALSLPVLAQTLVNDVAPSHPQSVSFNAGTQGFGLAYNYGFTNRFMLRGGANLLPVNANNIFTISDFDANSSLSAKFSSVHLWADFTPFKKASFFRLVGGAGYFIQASGHVTMTPTDTYKYGDITLSPQEVGVLNMDLKWNGFAPYAGVGLVHAFPARKFNVNVDLGTYYLSQPDAQVSGTGRLAGNSSQTPQFQRNMAGYRWYPQLQINFNYKL